MIKIDLITGFLGAGKTTFIKKYASYFIKQGQTVGILENDYGAINVDMMLLQDLMSDNCELEMISGGCDEETHRRRFKTKLISMGMCGYDRVIVEPSGVYDIDEFFDVIHDEPLDRWYEPEISLRLPMRQQQIIYQKNRHMFWHLRFHVPEKSYLAIQMKRTNKK